jgi:peptidoglycan/LPS O-acetylase OafA/YrhL
VSIVAAGARSDAPPVRAAAGDYRFFGCYRLLLAWAVLTSHANHYLPEWVATLSLGNVGVFCFFVLSGFVIAEAIDRFYPGAPHRFLANRLLRIYPTYWAAAAVAVAVYLALDHPDLTFDTRSLVANLSILYTPAGTFFWLSLIWAVVVELRFYFLAALASAAAALVPRRAMLVMAAFALGALALYFVTWRADFQRLASFRYAPFFVLGTAAYYLVAYRSWRATVLAALSLPLVFHSYWIYNAVGPVAPVRTTVVFGATLALMLALACAPVPARVARMDKTLGDFTYPLYLVHMPIVYLFGRVVPWQGWQGYIAVAAASVAAAGAIVLAVDRPLQRLRDRIRRRRLYA